MPERRTARENARLEIGSQRGRNSHQTAPSSLLWARKQAALAQTKNAISSFS